MLRDILTRFQGVDTWPCDEIPYIWRVGNARYPTDELPPGLATEATKQRIRARFESVATPTTTHIVEKTCANTLRVSFVDRVLPEARYVRIIRDGRDAAASAARRWTAEFNLSYTMAKARFVPARDVPYYAWRFARNRLARLTSRNRRLRVWGPVFEGLSELPPETPVLEIAARQWARCVTSADQALRDIDRSRRTSVRYEDFVKNPLSSTAEILDFLEIDSTTSDIVDAVKPVRASSVGKGVSSMNDEESRGILSVMREPLEDHGYLEPTAAS